MQNLTERENEIYKYICETMEANGYAPSVRDIKAALGIKARRRSIPISRSWK